MLALSPAPGARFTGLPAIACTVAAAVFGLAVPALAQEATASADPAQTPPVASGPLVVQPVRSGPVFGAEFKVTDIDGDVGTLVGGFGGWITDERFLIGGAGYWLANAPNDIDMFYGGLLVGWQVPAGRAFRFGLRGLVGGGEATLSQTFFVDYPEPPHWQDRPMPVHGGNYPPYGPGYARYDFVQGFFVFEPQAEATVRFGARAALRVGVGYRVIAGAGQFNDQLQGVTGSLALQLGVF